MVIVDGISYLIYLAPDRQESSGTYLGKYTGRSSQSLCCRCICISLCQSSCRGERKKAIVGIVMCLALGMTIPTHNVINLSVSATELGTTVRAITSPKLTGKYQTRTEIPIIGSGGSSCRSFTIG